ncbi:MAG: FAD-binding oxidoreductase, partial [Nitrospinaceae bacterium]|nr:FAD-binding oxidoreductase [Nitrospinaceae bacterium]
MNHSGLVEKLISAIGEDYVHTAHEAMRTYDHDALMIYKGEPGVVVLPDSTEDVRQVMTIC